MEVRRSSFLNFHAPGFDRIPASLHRSRQFRKMLLFDFFTLRKLRVVGQRSHTAPFGFSIPQIERAPTARSVGHGCDRTLLPRNSPRVVGPDQRPVMHHHTVFEASKESVAVRSDCPIASIARLLELVLHVQQRAPINASLFQEERVGEWHNDERWPTRHGERRRANGADRRFRREACSFRDGRTHSQG